MNEKPTTWCLFEDSLSAGKPEAGRVFKRPRAEISCYQYSELENSIAELQHALDSGFHLAGWFAYECGYFFEPSLRSLAPKLSSQPLLWFGVFDKPEILSSEECDLFWAAYGNMDVTQALANTRDSVSESEYAEAFVEIQKHITAGNIYQLNYTFKKLFRCEGKPEELYAAIRGAQRVRYGAYIQNDALRILSFSPELFVKKNGQELTCQPMKGTAARGLISVDDLARRENLRLDEKNRAENLMIVDLLRNDLGRLAETGSVRVEKLFEVDAYRTVLQMTSTIKAKAKSAIHPIDIVCKLFPCGSVTGAPKIRAMQIIRELEVSARGVYTGAVGFFSPDGDFSFNVPIRTLAMQANGEVELGIGSGIVTDSSVQAEYAECLLKSNFVRESGVDVELFETFKLDSDARYDFLQEHLTRLRASAEYFGFAFSLEHAGKVLAEHATRTSKTQRVRLSLDRHGTFSLTATDFADVSSMGIQGISISQHKTSPENVFLYHKTSARALYDSEYTHYQQKFTCYDVLFFNSKDELTEASRHNVFLELNGSLFTPPIACGLLPGILRQHMLDSGRAQEKILSRDDLAKATKVFLGNSVRGLIPVTLNDT